MKFHPGNAKTMTHPARCFWCQKLCGPGGEPFFWSVWPQTRADEEQLLVAFGRLGPFVLCPQCARDTNTPVRTLAEWIEDMTILTEEGPEALPLGPRSVGPVNLVRSHGGGGHQSRVMH